MLPAAPQPANPRVLLVADPDEAAGPDVTGLVAALHAHGCHAEVVIPPAAGWIAAVLAVRRAARAVRADAVVAVGDPDRPASSIGRLAGWAAGARLVALATPRLPFHERQSRRAWRLALARERVLGRLTGLLLVRTADDADHAVRHGTSPAGRVAIMGLGSPAAPDLAGHPDDPRAAARARLGLPAAGPVVAVVAHEIGGPALGTFVAAAQALAARHPEASFLVAGRIAGPAPQAPAELAGRLVLAGPLADPSDAIAAADVVAWPADHDGLPRPVVEAMAAGRPVVAASVRGIPEAVAEGETGHLVPPRNAGMLADRLGRLLADPALRARMGAAGRARAAARFPAGVAERRAAEALGRALGLEAPGATPPLPPPAPAGAGGAAPAPLLAPAAGTPPAEDADPARTAILFFTHTFAPDVLAALAKLRREAAGRGDVFVLCEATAPVPPDLDAIAHRFDFPTLLARFPRTMGPTLVPGNCHLPVIDFRRHHPGYARIWTIEYDVRFSGSWATLLDAFRDDPADLIGSDVRRHGQDPAWTWWWTVGGPAGPPDRAELVRAFLPIQRISARAIDAVEAGVDAGWAGHFEVLVPTLLARAGLSLADFGGTGEFVRPGGERRFYTSHPRALLERLQGGTMRFRPDHRIWGLRADSLYHPVKRDRLAWVAAWLQHLRGHRTGG